MRRITNAQIQDEFERFQRNVNVTQDGQRVLQQENRIAQMLTLLSGEVVEVAKDFFSMLKDHFDRKYKNLPTRTITAIIVALLYLLSPVDLIPDIIPILGLTDDVALIMFVYQLIKQDVEDYRRWKKQRILQA